MRVPSNSKSLTTCGDLLHIGTLIAHHLLSHLEATRSKLRCPHLLSAVTLPLARGFFGYRLVTYNLCQRAVLESITKTKYNSIKIAGSKSSDDHLQWNSCKVLTSFNQFHFVLQMSDMDDKSRVSSSPQQSSQSTPLQVWPPGLVWCHFLWGCSCPVAVGCHQTWTQSPQRS